MRVVWNNEKATQIRALLPSKDDFLFLLYTSGSTGKPKKWCTPRQSIFGGRRSRRRLFSICSLVLLYLAADINWIAGHSYIICGPLANECSTFMFESVPTYPNPGRYWDFIQVPRACAYNLLPTAMVHDLRSKRWVL